MYKRQVLIDTHAQELRSDGADYPLSKLPFVPTGKENRVRRCMEIFHMQVAGLKQRLSILGSAKAVVGISGGLDSTLALLVSVAVSYTHLIGDQPPDLSLKNARPVKAEGAVQKGVAGHLAEQVDHGGADDDVKHQIGDALVPVPEAEKLKFLA